MIPFANQSVLHEKSPWAVDYNPLDLPGRRSGWRLQSDLFVMSGVLTHELAPCGLWIVLALKADICRGARCTTLWLHNLVLISDDDAVAVICCNLELANMGWEEFADSLDEGAEGGARIFRGYG